MTVEVLDRDEMEFEMAGGPMAVVVSLAVAAMKWISIGILIRIGWRIVGSSCEAYCDP